MDEIKDVAKKDHLSDFLDNRTLRVQAFGTNISAERAYRRAERLVAAIHLVTNHIRTDEPAREIVRRSSVDLLSSVLMLRDELRSPESAAFRKVQALIRELISLVRILSIAGHISLQNAQALAEALDELANFLIVSQRTMISESVVFEKDEFLDMEQTPHRRRSSDNMSFREHKTIKDKQSREGAVSDRNTGTRMRGERIVGVLTNQGQLGIKDIAANLPEYSEKMIQRELKGLVTLGRIKKVGSKRWSMYALA